MNIKSLFSIIILLITFSCQQKSIKNPDRQAAYRYGTENDSAIYYFNKGWEHIMDYGQWTLSEKAFRKAVEFDPTFLVGKSLVGKITRDLEERQKLWDEINKKKHKASEDDQLLLEITLITMELFNARDQNIDLGDDFRNRFLEIAENNYGIFIHKYPDESYMKAEYVEVLHANHGAKTALDSLKILATKRQKELPFFISYRAVLESDVGNYTKAISIADKLKATIDNPDVPETYLVYAKIYSKMDSLPLAKTYVDKAVELDTNHIIAGRLKKQIDNKLNLKAKSAD